MLIDNIEAKFDKNIPYSDFREFIINYFVSKPKLLPEIGMEKIIKQEYIRLTGKNPDEDGNIKPITKKSKSDKTGQTVSDNNKDI